MLTGYAGAAEIPDIAVSSFYGKYDTATKKSGRNALSLRGPKIETWKRSEKGLNTWRIGVSFPQLKDAYWLAVNYGIMDEAERVGASVHLVEAGGYTNLEVQQEQLRQLAESGVDGIILASISYSGNNDLVEEIAEQGIPVVEVINDIEAGTIAAKAMVSFYDMGFYAGEFVTEQVEAGEKEEISVLFLPGPQGSGWADETLEGFQAATEFTEPAIRIADVLWGDTVATTQTSLVQKGLADNPGLDFVVGNAVAADVAADLFSESGLQTQIVATYITPPVYDKIRAGRIAAAPSDMTVDQARIAVGMLVDILNGKQAGEDFPFRSGPLIPVITLKNIDQYSFEHQFGPRGFTPIFNR